MKTMTPEKEDFCHSENGEKKGEWRNKLKKSNRNEALEKKRHFKQKHNTEVLTNENQIFESKKFGNRQEKKNESIRLNRYISNSGACSRREADVRIAKGRVSVNGKIVTEVGTKVLLTDKVCMDGKLLQNEAKVYLVLNKPKNFVTTVSDPMGRKTVIDLIKNACTERVYPVGRLDRMTTGVLLLTNDGELTKRLTHPTYNKKKIYHVFLNKEISQKELNLIKKGVELDDGFIKADAVSHANVSDKTQVGIEIHSGRNRIVRRIFEKLGYKVEKLDRVFFAGITKKNIPRGKWRFLSKSEIRMLKS